LTFKNPDVKVVLAMHGAPPIDFPKKELAEFFGLHIKEEKVPKLVTGEDKARCEQLEEKMRNWPRTKENDPFYVHSYEIANIIEERTGYETIVGFNEFCCPKLSVALEQAFACGPKKVVVITPMMTMGGEHAEKDIPQEIDTIARKFPEITVEYAWPFETSEIANFLIKQLNNSVEEKK
jgi:sirohydrochlorin cobaltochelatase